MTRAHQICILLFIINGYEESNVKLFNTFPFFYFIRINAFCIHIYIYIYNTMESILYIYKQSFARLRSINFREILNI